MKTSLTRPQWALIVILALAVAPYVIRLGASSLWDSNESFYAETPREMIEARDYTNPTFNFRPRLNKPPLSYWLVVPFYKVLGASETAERLAVALGAIVLIGAAYGLGRLSFSMEAGLLAAIGLAAAPRFLMFSRRIMIDVYLAMFMTLALLMFVLAEKLPGRRRVFLILMYAFIGFAVLTKGPVALALPGAVLLIYLAIYREFNRLRELMLPIGILIVALIVLPWYFAIYYQHGWSHIETFILKDNLSRYTQQVWGPRRGFFFYIPVMFGDFFPWSLFLIPCSVFGARRILARKDEHAAQSRFAVLFAIWIAVFVVFFSFSKSKEDLYILPIYPAAAALIGIGLANFFINGRPGQKTLMKWATLAVASLIGVAGAVILYLFGRGIQQYQLSGTSLIGVTAILGGLTGVIAMLLKKPRTAVLTTALTLAACNWMFVLRTLPDFERFKPVRSACELIASQASPDALVGYYRNAYPSMVFYLRRPIFEYYDQGEIEAVFSSGKEVFCLITEIEYQAIKPRLPAQTRVLASYPIFQVKLKSILERAEPPQVLLISNRGEINSTP